ncbi:MAG: DUF554 domain-containing protein [Thermoproteota archaeon]|nr:DUF554 domain-containing protein [Candidatus Brockarchaeota archaeon]
MIGTVVNVALVLAGGSTGLLIKKKMPERFESILMQAIGLFTLGLGALMAMRLAKPVSLVIGFLTGTLLGEAVKLQDALNSLGERLKNTLGGGERFTEGIVTSFLTFCIGPMTVIGAINDGFGDPTLLITKSIMDGVVSIAYAAVFGAGVLLSTPLMLMFQLPITVLASFAKPLLTQVILDNLTAQGGIMLLGLGLSLLEVKKIKVSNMLPSIVTTPVVTLILLPTGF